MSHRRALFDALLPHLVEGMGEEKVLDLLSNVASRIDEGKRLRLQVHGPATERLTQLRHALLERLGAVDLRCEAALEGLERTTPVTLDLAGRLLLLADDEEDLARSWDELSSSGTLRGAAPRERAARVERGLVADPLPAT